MGFFERIGKAFTFIGEASRMAFRDKDLMLPAVFALVLGIIALALCLWGAIASGVIIDGPTAATAGSKTAEGAGLVIGDKQIDEAIASIWIVIALLSTYLINFFFMGMICHLVDVHLKGEDARLAPAFGDALQNFFGIMTLACATVLVTILTSMMRGQDNRRGIGDIIAGIIDKVWTVATFLVLPIIMLEDVGMFKALGRARNLHRGDWIGVAVGEIGVSFVCGAIATVGILIPMGLVWLTGGALATSVIFWVVTGLWIAFLMSYTAYLRIAYYTCQYLWAASREREGATAPAPAPLQAAMAN